MICFLDVNLCEVIKRYNERMNAIQMVTDFPFDLHRCATKRKIHFKNNAKNVVERTTKINCSIKPVAAHQYQKTSLQALSAVHQADPTITIYRWHY